MIQAIYVVVNIQKFWSSQSPWTFNLQALCREKNHLLLDLIETEYNKNFEPHNHNLSQALMKQEKSMSYVGNSQ